MDRPDSDASDLKSGNDSTTETESSETDATTEDSMSTNDNTTETESTSDESVESKPVAETPQPFPLPVSEIVDALANGKGMAKTQEKQMVAIGGAVVLTGAYMALKAYPEAHVPAGVWNAQVRPIVGALFVLGFGSEGKKALQKVNQKRKK